MAVFRVNTYRVFVIGASILCFIIFWLISRRSVLNIDAPVVSLRRLLASSIVLSEQAGLKVKEVYDAKLLKTENKLSNEPVTQADLASNKIIVNTLMKAIPGLNLNSEEKNTIDDWRSIPPLPSYQSEVEAIIQNRDLFPRLDEITVWVDPLDATQEFTEGLTECVTVLICIAVRNEPAIGIINQPFQNRTYWSWKYFGESPSVKALRKEKPKLFPEGSTIRIVMSRSHVKEQTKNSLKSLLKPFNVEIISQGGSAFKVLEMLKDNADLYIHPTGSRKWDLCAPNAVLSALGGFMMYMDQPEKPIDYSSEYQTQIDSTQGMWATPHFDLYDKLKEKMKHIIAVVP